MTSVVANAGYQHRLSEPTVQNGDLVSPLAVLGFVLLGWVVAGAITGALFGLSLYVFGLAPVYFLLYVVLGGGEYYLRA